MITTPTCSQRRLKTHTADAADVVCVTTVTVVAAGMSNMTAASAGNVNRGELASQPRLRPAPVLENVPGLIVTQHSGEGTANQYFLGASTLDHNTDLATGAINAIGIFDTWECEQHTNNHYSGARRRASSR